MPKIICVPFFIYKKITTNSNTKNYTFFNKKMLSVDVDSVDPMLSIRFAKFLASIFPIFYSNTIAFTCIHNISIHRSDS